MVVLQGVEGSHGCRPSSWQRKAGLMHKISSSPRAGEVSFYMLLKHWFSEANCPHFSPLTEQQPNRLLPASPPGDAGVAAKMALCPCCHPANGCRCKAGIGDTQRCRVPRPSPPALSPAQMCGRAGGGWLHAAADGSLVLSMLLASFFTRTITKIRFACVAFCGGYWVT